MRWSSEETWFLGKSGGGNVGTSLLLGRLLSPLSVMVS